jgi:xylulokinase
VTSAHGDAAREEQVTPHGDLVLGYDVGTSAVKAALFDPEGAIHGSARAAYPTRYPAPGHAEQDPHDWWRAMAAATHELLAAVPQARERIAALGIAAQVCGTVPVDAAGEPLHPCLIWLDTRSAPIAHSITKGGPRIGGYGIFRVLGWLRLANGAPNLAGKDPLSKIVWFREALPEVGRRAARFLDVKDWLLHRCTGRYATTPDVAQLTWLMDNRIGRCDWSDTYLARFGLTRDQLPQIVEPAATAGTLTAAAAEALGLRAGLPVSGGVGDINAAALAAGDYGEGAYHLSIGTSLWFGAHTPRRRVSPSTGIATICAAHSDRYLLVATQESAGAAALWAASAFGYGEGGAGLAALDEHAAAASPGADTPLFAPWLYGERVPLSDASARGALAGATLRTTRADLAYSVLAGIALNARWALTESERCLASSAAPIRLLGGAARSATWRQIVADMLQRPLLTMEAPEFGGAKGAAMTAAVSVGWYRSLDDASAMARSGVAVEPQRSRKAWADQRYGELISFWRSTRRWHRNRGQTPISGM